MRPFVEGGKKESTCPFPYSFPGRDACGDFSI